MRLFLDTMIFVYGSEITSPFYAEASRVLQIGSSIQHRIISSQFVLGELLVLPRKTRDEFSEMRFRRLFRSSFLELASFTATALEHYVSLRARGVKPLDAVHRATAATANADLFITNDRKLIGLHVPGVGAVIGLNDALARLQSA